MLLAMIITIIAIGAVNLIASIVNHNDIATTKQIVSVCAEDPHGEACQSRALPRVFGDASPAELRRYQEAINERRKALEGGATP